MILLIDNYDSFSYNLYQLIGALNPDIRVIRNDAMTVGEIRDLRPDHIILSPGPGRPENAGIIVEAAATVCREIPTLGVCLGHQAICLDENRRPVLNGKKCVGCHLCILVCPQRAIVPGTKRITRK